MGDEKRETGNEKLEAPTGCPAVHGVSSLGYLGGRCAKHTVTPAKAGVQGGRAAPTNALPSGTGVFFPHAPWIPASAGMTKEATDSGWWLAVVAGGLIQIGRAS
jgi:hypothetical protein